MFKDGLVRLASEKYNLQKGNISDNFMHLTNYSLNKKSTNYDSLKHKLKLGDLLKGGLREKNAQKSGEQIWLEIEDIIIKTIITV